VGINPDIDELTPFFLVAGKPPHESSIAVPTRMAAPNLWI
jgi:hypothetical protein